MKIRIAVSIILSIIIGLAASYVICYPASDRVALYEIDAEDNLYTISEYNAGTFLQVLDSKTGKAEQINLRKYYKKTAQFIDMRFFSGKLYLTGIDYKNAFVDTFDKKGKRLSRVFEEEIKPNTSINLFLSFTNQWISEENYEDYRLDIIMVTDNSIISKRIDGKGDGQLKNLVFPNGSSIVWARYIGNHFVYEDGFGEFYWFDNNQNSQKLDIPEESVLYTPETFNTSIIATDLSDITLKNYKLVFDDESNTAQVIVNNVNMLKSSYPVAEDVYFKDLREVKLVNRADTENNLRITAFMKESGKPGRFFRIDDFGTMAANKEYIEPKFGWGAAVIVFAVTMLVSMLLLIFIVNLISYLLSLRKVVIKQVLVSTALVILASGFLYTGISSLLESVYDGAIVSSMNEMLKYIRQTIDADKFSRDGLSDEQRSVMRGFDYDNYTALDIKTDLFTVFSGFLFNSTIQYIEVARNVDDTQVYEYFTDVRNGALAEYFMDNDSLKRFAALTKDDTLIIDSKFRGMDYLESVCAIVDSKGNNAGWIKIGVRYTGIRDSVRILTLNVVLIIALILILTCVLFLVLLRSFLSPLKKLKKAVSEIAAGKIGTTVRINSGDEFQDIGKSFTDMSRKLEKYFGDINLISKTYERYLPRDFFALMDKRNVMEVKAEDRKDITLTYLFVGMNTNYIHSKSADGFAVINHIYGIVSESAAINGGVVQTLDDNCITCIFAGSSVSAAEAALNIEEKLSTTEYKDAAINITIQKAKATVGVIGTAQMMKTITVSSAIGLQQYISSLMKHFALTAVITGSAAEDIAELNVTKRFIGRVSDFGKIPDDVPDVKLYEIIDGCPAGEKQLKLSSFAAFNRGMDAIAKGDFREGRRNMVDVIRINRNDLIAAHYLMLCDANSKEIMEKKNESIYD